MEEENAESKPFIFRKSSAFITVPNLKTDRDPKSYGPELWDLLESNFKRKC